jgi:hypothetical protein
LTGGGRFLQSLQSNTMMLPRRRLLAASAALPAFGLVSGHARAATESPLILDLQRRTFRFFWETTNPSNGLAPDRWPSPSLCSIAAIGFALNAYPIGVENGWISREAARGRVLTTLKFLWDLPQGPEPEGVAGHKGFFYHFLDMKTGLRAGQCELSTVDTTLLLGGVLFCGGWFDRDHPDEAEIRRLAEALYARVDWTFAVRKAPLISMGWTPEHGWIPANWQGYNEGMLVYLLALGSPTHPISDDAWSGWCATYPQSWGVLWGQEHLTFPPLFGHQYSHAWVDFRGVQDAFMRSKGVDYFENSRRAVLAQKAYADANPLGFKGYGGDVWGLTACDGPGQCALDLDGRRRRFEGYFARGADATGGVDDGTLAPTAAAASIAFAPELATAAIEAMKAKWGAGVYRDFGFIDAFNPTLDRPASFERGGLAAGGGWADIDYLGIDQGPILAMIENWRTGLIWRTMRKNPHLRRGLTRAGFTGGWLAET